VDGLRAARTKRRDSQLDGVLVDVMFRPPRSFRLSDEAIGRRRRVAIGGVDAWVLAPEDKSCWSSPAMPKMPPGIGALPLAILAKHEIDWSVLGRERGERTARARPPPVCAHRRHLRAGCAHQQERPRRIFPTR
jgi:hypothetical protein